MSGNKTPPTPKIPVMNVVSIETVDVVNQSATGRSRTRPNITIDTSHYVGGIQVTPTIGDQWYVATIDGTTRLHSRIPFNDPNQTKVIPSQGQHVVGSGQGDVVLSAGAGNVIDADAPIATAAYTSANRPAASSVPAGSHVYDSTLGKPIWSNGTAWTDATGAIV